MHTQHEVTELDLHVSGEGIFFSTSGPPVSWHQNATEFVRQDWVKSMPLVRLLGTHENVPMIMWFHTERLLKKQPKNIRVASPTLCDLQAPAADIFRQMREIRYAPSVGGWHEFGPSDFPAYALSHALSRTNGDFTDHVMTQLKAHPAWHALSFIETIDVHNAARLLDKILDPRWHIDPANPDRWSRLMSYLGLYGRKGVANIKSYIEGTRPKDEFAYNARLTMSTWFQMADIPSKLGPHHFLHRALEEQVKQRPMEQAMLRVCNMFVRFLCSTWLDKMTPSRMFIQAVRMLGKKPKPRKTWKMKQEAQYSPTLFVPSYFFRNDDEISAWIKHVPG